MAWGKINITGGSDNGFPLFEYTGTYSIIDDGNKNWRIKFLTSGTLTLEKSMTVDVFMVGGGAGGDTTTARDSPYAGVGGGAGYTKTVRGIVLTTNAYTVQIAAGGSPATNGGTTSAFEQSCGGGKKDGSGGSGGIPQWTGSGNGQAGTDGGNGTRTGGSPSTATTYGQGTTTREFGEASGDLYAGGGGNVYNYGGDGGGGRSADANIRSLYGFNGAPNTGGGGAGQNDSQTGGSGGSGIVVIRNHRAA